MAEEIDQQNCNFRNFRSSVALTLDRVEVTRVRIFGQGLSTYQIRSKLEKLFVDGQTDGRTDVHTPDFSKSIRSSPGADLKINNCSCIFLNKTAQNLLIYKTSMRG